MFNTDTYQLLSNINQETFIISDTHFFHSSVLKFEPCRLEAMQRQGVGIGLDADNPALIPIHNDWIIMNWNSVVSNDDLIIHLGDIAWKGFQDIIMELNGTKILILGNHDKKGPNVYSAFDHVIRGSYKIIDNRLYISESTDSLFSSLELEIDNKKILLSHYPAHEEEHRFSIDKETGLPRPNTKINERIDELLSIAQDSKIDLNIHGHTHSNCYSTGYGYKFYNCSLENINFRPIKLGEILHENDR